MAAGELKDVIDELEWWMLLSGGISKEVSGGGIDNSEGRSKFLLGYLVEEDEVKMEASARSKVLCGKIGVKG